MTDQTALALTIWGEARGEPIEGKVGVAWVMRNRLTAGYRGAKTYVDVCTAHAQFSAWTEEAVQMRLAESQLENKPSAAWTPVLELCHEVAIAIIAGAIPDNTHLANHYYADTIPAPAWAVGKDLAPLPPLAHLGHHLFYNVA